MEKIIGSNQGEILVKKSIRRIIFSMENDLRGNAITENESKELANEFRVEPLIRIYPDPEERDK